MFVAKPDAAPPGGSEVEARDDARGRTMFLEDRRRAEVFSQHYERGKVLANRSSGIAMQLRLRQPARNDSSQHGNSTRTRHHCHARLAPMRDVFARSMVGRSCSWRSPMPRHPAEAKSMRGRTMFPTLESPGEPFFRNTMQLRATTRSDSSQHGNSTRTRHITFWPIIAARIASISSRRDGGLSVLIF